MIELRDVSYSYADNSDENTVAVKGISLKINKGEFIGIAGHTGSGKTTVAQILAGLIKPVEGEIVVDGKVFSDYKAAARALREKVGLVFQYPEHQLFEETVYRDIAFGPKNKGLSEKEIDECVRKSAKLAHLREELFEKSPFELSGGQKRRVAIAGVLATEPEILILDEPAAGLDPAGRDQLLGELHNICEKDGKTIILISHSMEDLAQNADRIIVLGQGEKLIDDITANVFCEHELLKKCGLEVPEVTKIVHLLNEGGMNLPENLFTVEKVYEAVLKCLEVTQ